MFITLFSYKNTFMCLHEPTVHFILSHLDCGFTPFKKLYSLNSCLYCRSHIFKQHCLKHSHKHIQRISIIVASNTECMERAIVASYEIEFLASVAVTLL